MREIGDEMVFASHVDFDQVNQAQNPLISLTGQLVSSEVTSATDAAWRLFLGTKVLESLLRDQGSSLSNDPRAIRVLEKLRDIGLADDDYPQVLRRVREKKVTAGISAMLSELGAKFGAETTSKEADTLSPIQVGNALISIAKQAVTESRHLITIDGLDKTITANRAYWETIAALIRVGDQLNTEFSAGSSIYVVVMCRTDIFRQVRFSDSAKILADSALRIEWASEAADPLDVALWDYLAKKAQITKAELLDYIPNVVGVGGGVNVKGPRFLLEMTRYTPRDVTVLFRGLQDAKPGGRALSGRETRSAADDFARNHFLNELESEAHGLLPAAVVDALPGIISSLQTRRFSRDRLEEVIRETGVAKITDVRALGEYLFIQGAIANWHPDSGYIQFYHRRNTNQFNVSGPWELHKSLVYGFNLKY